MTATADVHDTPIPEQPRRTPAMTVYCKALTHYSSCLQATTLMLRNNDAFTDEDLRQRERVSAARLRALDQAQQQADAGRDHCSRVRLTHGLLMTESAPAPSTGLTTRPGPADAADLEAGLATLALRRSQLDEAEIALDRRASPGRPPGGSSTVKTAAAKAALGALAASGAVALAKLIEVV